MYTYIISIRYSYVSKFEKGGNLEQKSYVYYKILLNNGSIINFKE